MRVTFSGVNPGDTKKRRGWLGSGMPFPRVIPHSDGAGVLESVGEGVDPARVGQRVWIFGAQSYRPFGTAAELTVIPAQQAVDLPADVPDEIRACLGIPRSRPIGRVFADGPGCRHDRPGARGARRCRGAGRPTGRQGRATVIGTVRRHGNLQRINASFVTHAVALDQPDPAGAIRAHAPSGVDRIVEVAFSDNIDLDAAVAKNQTRRRRLRHPPGPARPPVLTSAVRQHHHPPAR